MLCDISDQHNKEIAVTVPQVTVCFSLVELAWPRCFRTRMDTETTSIAWSRGTRSEVERLSALAELSSLRTRYFGRGYSAGGWGCVIRRCTGVGTKKTTSKGKRNARDQADIMGKPCNDKANNNNTVENEKVRLRLALSPEELELKHLRPEQKRFFETYRPDVLARLRKD